MQSATAVSQKRFIQGWDEFFEGIVQESIDKQDHRILDVKSYIDARRRTCGSMSAFAMIELELDIPDEVMAHPAIPEMILAAADMAGLSNVSDIHEKTLRLY